MAHRVFFHYNKPASQAAKKVIWSLHFKDQCHLVDAIQCEVPTETKINKRQPYAVVRGWATDVSIQEKVARIK